MRPVSRRLVVAVMLGTLLNPLNSSMIAVALVRLRADFAISVGQVAWVVSAFYLAGSVGQPLMGRLADRFGPRRLFATGLAVAFVSSGLSAVAPGFGWLVALRGIQAVGTSACFPAGLSMIRRATGDPRGRPPAAALAALNVANSVSAAFGPVVGGFLVSLAGWRAIFVVNLPVIALGMLLLALWVPADPARAPLPHVRRLIHELDVPGIVLFAATVGSLLGFLIEAPAVRLWPLAAAAPVLAVLLVWHERRRADPFLDVRMLARNRPLLGVYVQFGATMLVFYSIFLAIPVWLQVARGLAPSSAGVLVLPIAGLAVVAAPAAARLISRAGAPAALVLGSAIMAAGMLALLLWNEGTPLTGLLAVALILGVPNAVNTLALQALLYEHSPPEQTAAAGGLFQTFRYLGAIMSAALLGPVFGSGRPVEGLHLLAVFCLGVSLLLVLASFGLRRARPRS